jgi:hypothetical protein
MYNRKKRRPFVRGIDKDPTKEYPGTHHIGPV